MERGASFERFNTPEGRDQSWIEGIISPELLSRVMELPAYQKHTKEWVIMDALLSKLIEGGPEMDPAAKVRLRNFINAFRNLMIPNLNERELSFMRSLSDSDLTWGDTVMTEELSEDVRWVWNTFELRVPEGIDLESPTLLIE